MNTIISFLAGLAMTILVLAPNYYFAGYITRQLENGGWKNPVPGTPYEYAFIIIYAGMLIWPIIACVLLAVHQVGSYFTGY